MTMTERAGELRAGEVTNEDWWPRRRSFGVSAAAATARAFTAVPASLIEPGEGNLLPPAAPSGNCQAGKEARSRMVEAMWRGPDAASVARSEPGEASTVA